eukprot:15950_1
MNDDHKSNNIDHLVIKFSALICPSDTRCKKCVGVLTVYDAYHDLGLPMASCDKCEQTLYETDVVLHCPPNAKHHHEGYDLCVICGHKMLKKQQKSQQNILRQVIRDKKRKNRENDDISDGTPKKKRKRGRPRKNPLPSPNSINTNDSLLHSPKSNLNLNLQANNINNNMANVINININNYNQNQNQSGPQSMLLNTTPGGTPQSYMNDPNACVSPLFPENNTHYKDWEDQLMDNKFTDNYIKYLRTAPNLYENSIKIINRYSSWLDFTRLNEGSEINILNILLEFEDIINTNNNNSYS